MSADMESVLVNVETFNEAHSLAEKIAQKASALCKAIDGAYFGDESSSVNAAFLGLEELVLQFGNFFIGTD